MRRLTLLLLPLLLAACSGIPGLGRGRTEWWAFTTPGDAAARADTMPLDVVVSGWIAFDTLTGEPRRLDADTVVRRGVRRMALVTTWLGEGHHPQIVRALSADTARLTRAAARVAELARAGEYDGVVIDFAELQSRDVGPLVRVVGSIARAARARGLARTVVAVPAADTAAYPAQPLLIAGADLVLVLLYDQHWSGSPPGAVAEPYWVREMLGARVAEVGANRLIAALPLYGYVWPRNEPGRPVTWLEATRIAAEGAVSLERDPSSRALRASRVGDWILFAGDAEHLSALADEVRARGVRRIAMWRIGGEDPGVWAVVRARR